VVQWIKHQALGSIPGTATPKRGHPRWMNKPIKEAPLKFVDDQPQGKAVEQLISRWYKNCDSAHFLKINEFDILTKARQQQNKGEYKNFIFPNGPQKST
jgi:hypothetical protein